MGISSVTPYLSVVTPVVGAIAALDYVVHDNRKQALARRLVQIFNAVLQPHKLTFYLFVLSASVLLMGFTIIINGSLHALIEGERSILLTLKSTGPILLAAILKLLIWDYMLAMKSHFLWTTTSKFPKGHERDLKMIFFRLLMVLMDLCFSCVCTKALFDVMQQVQQHQLAPSLSHSTGVIKAAYDFFDQLSLTIASSLQKALFILNGSVIYYLALLIVSIFRATEPSVDAGKIKENVFKILACICGVLITAMLVCYAVANK